MLSGRFGGGVDFQDVTRKYLVWDKVVPGLEGPWCGVRVAWLAGPAYIPRGIFISPSEAVILIYLYIIPIHIHTYVCIYIYIYTYLYIHIYIDR